MAEHLSPCPFCGRFPERGERYGRMNHYCPTLDAHIDCSQEAWETRVKPIEQVELENTALAMLAHMRGDPVIGYPDRYPNGEIRESGRGWVFDAFERDLAEHGLVLDPPEGEEDA